MLKMTSLLRFLFRYFIAALAIPISLLIGAAGIFWYMLQKTGIIEPRLKNKSKGNNERI